MRTLFLVLSALAVIATAVDCQAQSLTTLFASNNNQAGNMFDVIANDGAVLQSFDLNLAFGQWDIEVYNRVGSHVGVEMDPNAWNLVAAVPGVNSNGPELPTPLPAALDIDLLPGQIYAFYVTCTNGTGMRYTSGVPAVGTILASDANLSILVGTGNGYPFGAVYAPRSFNGTIHYTGPRHSSLTTTYVSNNNQSGNMFNVTATSSVVVRDFALNLGSGTWDVEVYTKTGSHVGFEQSPLAWGRVAIATGIVSNGSDTPTPVGFDLAVPMLVGQTRAFYLTVTAGSGMRYTSASPPVGSVLASNSDLSIFVGTGNSYPFGAVYAPRQWNGTIFYDVCSSGEVPFQLNSAKASLDHNGIQPDGCSPGVTVVSTGQSVVAHVGTTLLGMPSEAVISLGAQVPRGDPRAYELADGQVFNVPLGAPGSIYFWGGLSPNFQPGVSFTLPFTAPSGPATWCAQFFYFDFSSPTLFTLSAASSVSVVNAQVTVEAVGTNNLNSVTTEGFFRVHNQGDGTITELTLDWATTTNPLQASAEFDTDQTGLADRFDGGNSSLAGCSGTYRVGSAAATGLIFAGTQTSPCDPGARTGWIGSHPTSASSYQTLDFLFGGGFLNGTTFQFDADVDLAAGVSGGAMAGLVARVVVGGVELTGQLAIDPTNPNRSFVILTN